MADEETRSTEEQNSDAPAEEQGAENQQEESQEQPEQPADDSSSQEDRDATLEAELERERERRKKAEEKAADTAYKKREQKRKEDEGEEEEETPSQITKDDLLQLEERLTKQQQEREARELAKSMASSDTEAELVLEYYQNRITPTGNLREDMESAYAIANRKQLLRQPQEQKRAQDARESAHTGDASSTRRRNASEPNMSSGDQAFLNTANMTWNPQRARYEGKHTWYDPKTGDGGRL